MQEMFRVEVYVPNEPIAPAIDLKNTLIELAGGLTTSMSFGSWRNSAGELVIEPVGVLTVILRSGLELPRVEDAIEKYKQDAEQECVLYTIDSIRGRFLEN